MKLLFSFMIVFFACSTSESIVEKVPSSEYATPVNNKTLDNGELQSELENYTIISELDDKYSLGKIQH